MWNCSEVISHYYKLCDIIHDNVNDLSKVISFIFTVFSPSNLSSSVNSLSSSSHFTGSSNSVAHHHTPPSRVIHCRAVADGCKETDLIQVLQPFGKITWVFARIGSFLWSGFTRTKIVLHTGENTTFWENNVNKCTNG